MNLRIISINGGTATYKVDGSTRTAALPKGIKDISDHLLKLEGGCGLPDKPAPKPKKKDGSK